MAKLFYGIMGTLFTAIVVACVSYTSDKFIVLIVLLAVFGTLLIVWLLYSVYQNKEDISKLSDQNKDSVFNLFSMENKLGLLLGKFNSLITVLYSSDLIKDAGMFEVHSPITLSDSGKEFIEKIGWQNIISNEQNKKAFFDALDKLNLKIKADVQKYALIILLEFYEDMKENRMGVIKDYFYNNPETSQKPEENKSNALFACSIDLRDKYLESHSDIV